ncbi:rhodanese-like domain-containing protein [Lactococcus garvieae]|uniref:rhodanese-like domain-containing protein n=1 Tax=Lactococcus garvieae TaxID=1363 RepID=UPI0018DA18C7|nr:rhodanese-like domain-containing protein [Lactococcus garvieae]QPS71711.1 rhodanese-like domain-containing protein [Lactococcus garvieae]
MFGLLSKINNITTADLAAQIRTKKNFGALIDVREPYEYNNGHIMGARNIPLAQISSCTLSVDKEYFIICQSGMRSRKAYKELSKKGYRVTNVIGGMAAWEGKVTRKK